MDYLGESGIGAWSYGTPEQAQMAEQVMGAMVNSSMIDKMFLGMANGIDVMATMTQGAADPAAKAAMAIISHRLSLARGSLRRPRLDRLSQTAILLSRHPVERRRPRVRHPCVCQSQKRKDHRGGLGQPVPRCPPGPGHEQKNNPLQVEVYSGTERVRLCLNDKLVGEQPTGRDQGIRTTFCVPYTPGTLNAVGMRGDSAVAESILTTAGNATALRITADRTTIQANGQDLAFLTMRQWSYWPSLLMPPRKYSSPLVGQARSLPLEMAAEGMKRHPGRWAGCLRARARGSAHLATKWTDRRDCRPWLERRVGNHPGNTSARGRRACCAKTEATVSRAR